MEFQKKRIKIDCSKERDKMEKSKLPQNLKYKFLTLILSILKIRESIQQTCKGGADYDSIKVPGLINLPCRHNKNPFKKQGAEYIHKVDKDEARVFSVHGSLSSTNSQVKVYASLVGDPAPEEIARVSCQANSCQIQSLKTPAETITLNTASSSADISFFFGHAYDTTIFFLYDRNSHCFENKLVDDGKLNVDTTNKRYSEVRISSNTEAAAAKEAESTYILDGWENMYAIPRRIALLLGSPFQKFIWAVFDGDGISALPDWKSTQFGRIYMDKNFIQDVTATSIDTLKLNNDGLLLFENGASLTENQDPQPAYFRMQVTQKAGAKIFNSGTFAIYVKMKIPQETINPWLVLEEAGKGKIQFNIVDSRRIQVVLNDAETIDYDFSFRCQVACNSKDFLDLAINFNQANPTSPAYFIQININGTYLHQYQYELTKVPDFQNPTLTLTNNKKSMLEISELMITSSSMFGQECKFKKHCSIAAMKAEEDSSECIKCMRSHFIHFEDADLKKTRVCDACPAKKPADPRLLFWKNPESRLCMRCSKSCECEERRGCSRCLTDQPGQGFIYQHGTCQRCFSACKTCQNDYRFCTSCNDPQFLYNKDCVANCVLENHFVDDLGPVKGKVCLDCPGGCRGCQSEDSVVDPTKKVMSCKECWQSNSLPFLQSIDTSNRYNLECQNFNTKIGDRVRVKLLGENPQAFFPHLGAISSDPKLELKQENYLAKLVHGWVKILPNNPGDEISVGDHTIVRVTSQMPDDLGDNTARPDFNQLRLDLQVEAVNAGTPQRTCKFYSTFSSLNQTFFRKEELKIKYGNSITTECKNTVKNKWAYVTIGSDLEFGHYIASVVFEYLGEIIEFGYDDHLYSHTNKIGTWKGEHSKQVFTVRFGGYGKTQFYTNAAGDSENELDDSLRLYFVDWYIDNKFFAGQLENGYFRNQAHYGETEVIFRIQEPVEDSTFWQQTFKFRESGPERREVTVKNSMSMGSFYSHYAFNFNENLNELIDINLQSPHPPVPVPGDTAQDLRNVDYPDKFNQAARMEMEYYLIPFRSNLLSFYYAVPAYYSPEVIPADPPGTQYLHVLMTNQFLDVTVRLILRAYNNNADQLRFELYFDLNIQGLQPTLVNEKILVQDNLRPRTKIEQRWMHLIVEYHHLIGREWGELKFFKNGARIPATTPPTPIPLYKVNHDMTLHNDFFFQNQDQYKCLIKVGENPAALDAAQNERAVIGLFRNITMFQGTGIQKGSACVPGCSICTRNQHCLAHDEPDLADRVLYDFNVVDKCPTGFEPDNGICFPSLMRQALNYPFIKYKNFDVRIEKEGGGTSETHEFDVTSKTNEYLFKIRRKFMKSYGLDANTPPNVVVADTPVEKISKVVIKFDHPNLFLCIKNLMMKYENPLGTYTTQNVEFRYLHGNPTLRLEILVDVTIPIPGDIHFFIPIETVASTAAPGAPDGTNGMYTDSCTCPDFHELKKEAKSRISCTYKPDLRLGDHCDPTFCSKCPSPTDCVRCVGDSRNFKSCFTCDNNNNVPPFTTKRLTLPPSSEQLCGRTVIPGHFDQDTDSLECKFWNPERFPQRAILEYDRKKEPYYVCSQTITPNIFGIHKEGLLLFNGTTVNAPGIGEYFCAFTNCNWYKYIAQYTNLCQNTEIIEVTTKTFQLPNPENKPVLRCCLAILEGEKVVNCFEKYGFYPTGLTAPGSQKCYKCPMKDDGQGVNRQSIPVVDTTNGGGQPTTYKCVVAKDEDIGEVCRHSLPAKLSVVSDLKVCYNCKKGYYAVINPTDPLKFSCVQCKSLFYDEVTRTFDCRNECDRFPKYHYDKDKQECIQYPCATAPVREYYNLEVLNDIANGKPAVYCLTEENCKCDDPKDCFALNKELKVCGNCDLSPLVSNSDACRKRCVIGQFLLLKDGFYSCTVSCPAETYESVDANTNIGECIPCSKEGYIIKDGECIVGNCREGEYKDTEDFTCKPCYSSCISCTGKRPNQCTQCKTGYGKDVFKAEVGECLRCSIFCFGCNTNYFKNCFECRRPYLLYEATLELVDPKTNKLVAHLLNQCDINQCDPGTIIDLDNRVVGYPPQCSLCSEKFPHCEICNEKHCRLCKDGYYPVISVDPITQQAYIEECLGCKELINGKSGGGHTHFYYDGEEGGCKEICGDGFRYTEETAPGLKKYLECDDGNRINGDGCSSNCEVEVNWSCSGGSFNKPDNCLDNVQPEAKLIKVTQNLTIEVEFSKQMVINEKIIEQLISLNLLGFNPETDYSYTITWEKSSGRRFYIKVLPRISLNNATFMINFLNVEIISTKGRYLLTTQINGVIDFFITDSTIDKIAIAVVEKTATVVGILFFFLVLVVIPSELHIYFNSIFELFVIFTMPLKWDPAISRIYINALRPIMSFDILSLIEDPINTRLPTRLTEVKVHDEFVKNVIFLALIVGVNLVIMILLILVSGGHQFSEYQASLSGALRYMKRYMHFTGLFNAMRLISSQTLFLAFVYIRFFEASMGITVIMLPVLSILIMLIYAVQCFLITNYKVMEGDVTAKVTKEDKDKENQEDEKMKERARKFGQSLKSKGSSKLGAKQAGENKNQKTAAKGTSFDDSTFLPMKGVSDKLEKAKKSEKDMMESKLEDEIKIDMDYNLAIDAKDEKREKTIKKKEMEKFNAEWSLTDKRYNHRYSMIFLRMKIDSFYSRLFIFCDLICSFILVIITAILDSNIVLQSFVIMVMNFTICLYAAVFKPYVNNRDNMRLIADKIINFVVSITVFFFAINQQNSFLGHYTRVRFLEKGFLLIVLVLKYILINLWFFWRALEVLYGFVQYLRERMKVDPLKKLVKKEGTKKEFTLEELMRQREIREARERRRRKNKKNRARNERRRQAQIDRAVDQGEVGDGILEIRM